MITKIFPTRVPNYVMRNSYRNEHYPTHVLFASLELGVRETGPMFKNHRIKEYFNACGGLPLDETFSWCAAFVSYCLRKAYSYGFPKEACRSQWFLDYGHKVEEPMIGDVVVFTDTFNDSFGHVGFYIDETERSVLVLGGNQKNEVCYMWYKKDGKKLKLNQYRRVV